MPSYRKEEENGTWTLIYDFYVYENGKKKRKQKWVRGFKREKDAKAYYLDIMAKIKTENPRMTKQKPYLILCQNS